MFLQAMKKLRFPIFFISIADFSKYYNSNFLLLKKYLNDLSYEWLVIGLAQQSVLKFEQQNLKTQHYRWKFL